MPRVTTTTAEEKKANKPPAETKPPKPVKIVERRIEAVVIEAPLGEIGPGHRSRHVQLWLNTQQAETMQRLVVGLRDKREVTVNGKEVRSAADTIRWLLEALAKC